MKNSVNPVSRPILKKTNVSRNVSLKCAERNINRGLIKREAEIIKLLSDENLDILFLTETDNLNIKNEDSYKIQGYTTVLQNRTNETDVIRILGLIKNEINCFSKIRLDLMSVSLPSIWIEIKQERATYKNFFLRFD